MSRPQAGDEADFAALFHRYKDLVYRTAFLILGDQGEAEDALQEVFLLVYTHLPSFDPGRAAFTTWLHRITVNHCLNRRRHRDRRNRFPPPDPADTSDADPEAQYLDREQAERVHRAVGRLSRAQRAVVVLRYFHGLSYAEISRVLDIPLGTVKSRLNLALRTLGRELAPTDRRVPAQSLRPREEHRP
ncbi:MAG: sigma-70 family RNA polymerase sigma factor [Bacillota bacterium]|nr:sigma-70 family RNA polymerase sigma factor [Bacillota bacterium]MDI7249276.1 sigma-70 family RNA polymerase sigma factor [Bacillota bacterium]